jgi:hypothetical protein
MTQPKNAMEIFRLLDKSNCRECGEKTCLAFAGAVFQGRRHIDECPKLDRAVTDRFGGRTDRAHRVDAERQAYFEKLRREVAQMDLAEAAQRAGGRLENGKLTVKVLGKRFSVDADGRLYAEIHVNPWVAVPFLNYVLYGKGAQPAGVWVPFRELAGGRQRYPLFQKRCEEPMKQLADTLTDFFDDIIHMFSGKKVAEEFKSDISVVLHPLPKIPIMICYWKPDDGLESSLNLFFDQSADDNLDIGSIFSLGTGLAQMFGKLALRHGFTETPTASLTP